MQEGQPTDLHKEAQDLQDRKSKQLEAYGKVLVEAPAKPVVTAGGEVLTPGDRAAELQTREVQGHAYQQ